MCGYCMCFEQSQRQKQLWQEESSSNAFHCDWHFTQGKRPNQYKGHKLWLNFSFTSFMGCNFKYLLLDMIVMQYNEDGSFLLIFFCLVRSSRLNYLWISEINWVDKDRPNLWSHPGHASSTHETLLAHSVIKVFSSSHFIFLTPVRTQYTRSLSSYLAH